MLFWLSKTERLEIYFSMLYLVLVLKFLQSIKKNKKNYYQLKFQISL